MREIKGSYLLWGTIVIYLLYLFLNWINIDIIRLLINIIIIVSFIFICGLLGYTQLVIPSAYCESYKYYYHNHDRNLKYKDYYLSNFCESQIKKYIKFSLIYWIRVIIIEINTFCNKYFTFKF